MQDEPIRVLLADDHPVYRDGLAALLASVDGLDVVGTAEDGEAAVALAAELQPDVVVLLDRSRDDPDIWGSEQKLRDGRTLPLAKAALVTSRDTLDEITRVAPAVVIQRLPMPNTFDAGDCLASSKTVGQCAVDVPIDPSPTDGVYSTIAAENPDVHALSLGAVYCPTAPICLPVVRGTVVFRDDHHYTVDWAMERRAALWKALGSTGLFG